MYEDNISLIHVSGRSGSRELSITVKEVCVPCNDEAMATSCYSL